MLCAALTTLVVRFALDLQWPETVQMYDQTAVVDYKGSSSRAS
jgi:hypothetical protein